MRQITTLIKLLLHNIQQQNEQLESSTLNKTQNTRHGLRQKYRSEQNEQLKISKFTTWVVKKCTETHRNTIQEDEIGDEEIVTAHVEDLYRRVRDRICCPGDGECGSGDSGSSKAWGGASFVLRGRRCLRGVKFTVVCSVIFGNFI